MTKPNAGAVNVKIYDREYALRTSGDAERLLLLCDYLNRKMREVAESSGSVDTLKVAILTALSVTDDLFRLQEEFQKMDEVIGRRSMECVSILDRFLQ
jgi:cell division protein ZapA